MKILIQKDEMVEFLDEVFPQVVGMFGIDRMDEELLVMRLFADEKHLRPGNTVSGPAMFSLVDVAAYVATMGFVGKEALAVTTHCSIDFMRKPEAGKDVVAHAKVLKLGKALSVVNVLLYTDGQDKPVAQASLTYSIPPSGRYA